MSWCVVDKHLISSLVSIIDGRRVLEVYSGKGELASALMKEGIEIKATGKLQSSYDGYNPLLACEIEDIDAASAARKYRDDFDIILVSWAIADDSFLQAAMLFNKPILFIGELYHKHEMNELGYSGTASDNYFENVNDVCEPIKLSKGHLSCHILKKEIVMKELIILNMYPWSNRMLFEAEINLYNLKNRIENVQ
jgi:hypothetical protein